jgi:hypothetical protein
MDPTSGGSHALLATLIALAMGLVKVLEKFADWLMKRGKDDKSTMVASLDAEASRMVRETYEKGADVHQVVSRTDNDGIPMVYTPRSYLDNQLRMAEALRDVSKGTESNAEKIDEILRSLKK